MGMRGLIHVPEKEWGGILEKIVDAMCQGGILFLSFRDGDFEGFQGEQYFCDCTEEKLERILEKTRRLEVKKTWVSRDGNRNSDGRWVNVLAKKVS